MPSYDINKHDASDKHISPSLRTKAQGPEIRKTKKNPLDGEEAQKRLKKLMQWRRQARVAQADNRTEMAIDEDFYDGIQLEPEDLRLMLSRAQAPLVFNMVKNTMNWVLGTERKSRVDYRVLPRKKDGSKEAKVKTKVMKYISDVSKAEYARSMAFTEAVCAGVGWLEVGARNTDEILFIRDERWRNMWFDHLSIRPDGSDMRYVVREKWVDLDVAMYMFPEREDELKVMAEGVNSLYPYHPDDTVITDNASEFDLDSLYGGPFDGMRERLKLVEMEYRMPQHVQIMRSNDTDTPYGVLNGAIYNPKMEDHKYLVKGGYFTTTDAYKLVVRRAIWAGRTLLHDDMSPYIHNRFSFIPIFCYRRKRDNMPYGIIRDLRDPQSDFNRRRSKALFLLTANQVVVEKNAVDDIVEFHAEMQRPDGIAMVNEGKMNAWREVKHDAQVGEHAKIAQDDERFIHSISGITNDANWQSRKELSGKAIGMMEQQGMTAHGVVFDNYFYAIQFVGEILLSNIEQFYDQEKEIRVTGDQQQDDFVKVNERKDDGTIENSITRNKADFIVSKQDYRETIRQNMTEQLLTLITNLSKTNPQVSNALLDLAIELMDDLPNKEEAVARIRKITGQHAPEDEMTPEEKQKVAQQEQAVAQEHALMKQIQQGLAQVKMAKDKSVAMKNMADAAIKKLEGFLKALEVAGTMQFAPQIVQAADEIVAEAQNIGGQQEQAQQQQGQPQQQPQQQGGM